MPCSFFTGSWQPARAQLALMMGRTSVDSFGPADGVVSGVDPASVEPPLPVTPPLPLAPPLALPA
jgi:hypothetical protein